VSPPAPATPPGFSAIREHGARWIAATAHLDALRAAGLLDPARVERLLATATGAAGRAATALVPLGALACVVRPVTRGGVFGPWLGRAFADPRRPLDELAVTARLAAAGAPVPDAVLAGAWRRGLAWNGIVATRFEAGAHDGEHYLRDGPAAARIARAAASAGAAVRRFHDAGGRHPDLHVKNLLVRDRDDACEVIVIDLDRARCGVPPGARERMRELMRLHRSLRKRDLLGSVGARGCARFFGAYVGCDRTLRTALLARLPAERRRNALHALRY
jgi:hypothetical protein